MTIRGRSEEGTHGRESGCEAVEWVKSEEMSLGEKSRRDNQWCRTKSDRGEESSM